MVGFPSAVKEAQERGTHSTQEWLSVSPKRITVNLLLQDMGRKRAGFGCTAAALAAFEMITLVAGSAELWWQGRSVYAENPWYPESCRLCCVCSLGSRFYSSQENWKEGRRSGMHGRSKNLWELVECLKNQPYLKSKWYKEILLL